MSNWLPSLLVEFSRSHQTLRATKQLHSLTVTTHLARDPFYATKIIRFYAINNALHSARILFDKTLNRSIYTWNSIIRAYAQHRQFDHAFSLFKQMLCCQCRPDNYTFSCILRACMEKTDVISLRAAHGGLVVSDLESDSVCCSALVNAYSKLGLVHEACKAFNGIVEPDLVLWNSMIMGYGSCRLWHKGLELFSKMRHFGENPDGYTLVGLISGFDGTSLLVIGEGVHGFSLKAGFCANAHVRSSLVSMYSRFNYLNSAYKVFSSSPWPDLVVWSALITGLVDGGEPEEALRLFREMNLQGQRADPLLISSLLAGCARLAAVRPAKEMHGFVLRFGYLSDAMVGSALINMYSKCGYAAVGIQVFETLQERNVVTYNSVISCLTTHGLASDALKLFEDMLEEGFKPDQSTFSAVLYACSFGGFVEDGQEYFRRMKEEFHIQASSEHYVHMVKLLGMAGQLELAYNLIETMPGPPDTGVLGALLSCCVVHGNAEMGGIVACKLSAIEPENTAYRVMLSNIYASKENWEDVKTLRESMVAAGLRKTPGLSWIEDNNA
ncbi:hypothetical protein Syun_024174 [Stephania yunnanensis]|uniref:Pentatricopeptide repeat-containing protein n=1 Tax=Stephania yunnanensis TaxID=152371 RepID=A0AAP0I0B0_9MAGN